MRTIPGEPDYACGADGSIWSLKRARPRRMSLFVLAATTTEASVSSLARRYGVTRATVRRIRDGRIWRAA